MRQQKFRGNVFVANLPKGFTDGQLAEAFEPYGMVISAYIARDLVSGARKRHGLVNIAPEEAAHGAIAALNGTEIGGRVIEARLADPTMALAFPKPAFSAAPPEQTASIERTGIDRPFGDRTGDYRPATVTRTFQVERRGLPRRDYLKNG